MSYFYKQQKAAHDAEIKANRTAALQKKITASAYDQEYYLAMWNQTQTHFAHNGHSQLLQALEQHSAKKSGGILFSGGNEISIFRDSAKFGKTGSSEEQVGTITPDKDGKYFSFSYASQDGGTVISTFSVSKIPEFLHVLERQLNTPHTPKRSFKARHLALVPVVAA